MNRFALYGAIILVSITATMVFFARDTKNYCVDELKPYNFTNASAGYGRLNWNIRLNDGTMARLTSDILPSTLKTVSCCNGNTGIKLCQKPVGGWIE